MIKYRRDIDGLRAVAVLPVVAHHLNWLGGGFVGVDIFFVISGYLITSIIFRDLVNSEFSLATFYKRRILRIVPALTIMTLVALGVGYFLMLPEEYASLGRSAGGAALSVSNIMFRSESGYFNDDSALKPLLHTWSLGVEEQFYVVFPLIMMLGYRFARNRLGLIVAAVAALSLALAVWQVAAGLSTDAFFLLPARAWELGIGALLGLGKIPPLKGRLREAASITGLAAIGVSMLLYSPRTPFPGLSAIPPCLGAALLIHAGAGGAGERQPLFNRLLSLAPFVFIGQISYSLYLVHWPVIVFGRLGIEHFGTVAKLGSLLVMFPLAWASWRFVEQPFRKLASLPSKLVLIRGGGVIVAMSLVSFGIAGARGFEGRFSPKEVKVASALNFDTARFYRSGRCFLGREHKIADYDVKGCLHTGAPVLVIGDSHAAHLLPGLNASVGLVNQANASGCKPLVHRYQSRAELCGQVLHNVFAPAYHPAGLQTIVVAARWAKSDISDLKATVRALREKAPRIIVIGPVPQYDQALPRLIIKGDREGNPDYTETHLVEGLRTLDDQIAAELKDEPGVVYFSAMKYFCSPTHCRTTDADGEPLAWDYGHLTLTGSRSLVSAAFRQAEASAEPVQSAGPGATRAP